MRRGDCREVESQTEPRTALAILFSNYNRDGLAPATKVVGSCGVVLGVVGSYDVDVVIVEVVGVAGSCDAAAAAVVVVVVAAAAAAAVAAAPAAVVSVAATEAGV